MSPPLRLAVLLGLALVALLLAIDIGLAGRHDGLLISNSAIWGRDFANVWSAGRILLEGDLAVLYDVESYQRWQTRQLDPGIVNHNYSYPPTSLLFAWVFGSLSYPVALGVWLALSALAFASAARPWLADAGLGGSVAILLPTTALCLWAGHYGLFFGALWLWAWRVVDRDPRTAGIATGLMLIKPHLALLMPLLLALKGSWRAFGWAALTVGVLVGASMVLFGVGPWVAYLTETSGLQLGLIDNVGSHFAMMMPSVFTSAAMLGAGAMTAWWAQAIVALVALGLLLRMPRTAVHLCFGGAIATFLILPYGFNYDLTIVGLAALLFGHKAANDRDRLGLAVAMGALLIAPAMNFLGFWKIQVAPLILLLLLGAIAQRRERAFGRPVRDAQPDGRPPLPGIQAGSIPR